MTKSWRSLRTRIIGVSVALLAIMVVSGQQAYAATHVVKDHKYDTYASTNPDATRLVRTNSATDDIISVRTTHGAKAVNVVIKTRKLPRSDNMAEVEFLTSAAHHARFALLVVRGEGYKAVELINESDPSGDVSCRKLRVRFDVAHAAVRVHVPRSCLGGPRWVRTGVMLMDTDSDGNGNIALDVAGKTVLTGKWLNHSAHLPLSPKVHVG